MTTSTRSFRRGCARGALLLGAVTASLLIVELVLTAWYGGLGRRGPYEIIEEWDSPFVFRTRSAVAGNALGLRRSQAVELAREPGSLRVLSYGDSVAGGYGIAEEEMYASRLESRLGATGDRKVEILSMARGNSPSVYGFHLRSDWPRLRPDGVLLQIELLNDVSDEARVRTAGRDEDGLPLEIHNHRYILGWDGHILAPLGFSGSWVERTKLYAKLTRWLGRVREKLSPNPIFAPDSDVLYYSTSADRAWLDASALERGFDRIFEAASQMQAFTERRGGRFLLVIVPSRHVFTEDRFSESSRRIVARARERATLLGIPNITPDAPLREGGGADLFMDFCHPTAEGNAVIARALAPLVAAW